MKRPRFVKIRSKHPSHSPLRAVIPASMKAVVRFGSSTEMPPDFIEINHKDVAKMSGNKRRMKEIFTEAGVKTAEWWTCKKTDSGTYMFYFDKQGFTPNNLPYPLVAKHIFGSQGKGNTLLKSEEELISFLEGKNLNQFIFEKFYNYSREYRLHVDSEGCFYACRKMLKSDTPQEERWHRHADTSVWIVEENPLFETPNSWEDIVEDCVAVLDEMNADFLAFDVKVQSSKDKNGIPRDYQEYIIIEANSAPSLGGKGVEIYKKKLPEIINRKINASKV